MPKYIVGYNLPGCIPDEPPFEHDSFEDAKEEVIWYIENYIDTLKDKDEIKRYEHLRYFINEYYNDEDVPFSVRVGMNNVWLEKSDNTSEEEF